MKKIFLSFAALCMSAMMMAASAKTVIFDFSNASNPWKLPTSNVIGENTYTNGTLSVKINGTGYVEKEETKGGLKTQEVSRTIVGMIMGKKGSYITLPEFDFNVATIKVYGLEGGSKDVKFNVFVGDDAVSTAVTSCKVTQVFKIAEASQIAGTIYTIKVTNAYNIQISKIEVVEAVAGAPENPVFSPKGGTYSREQNVSLSCATDGADILYSYDGSTYLDYSSPLTVDYTQTIYAKAVKNSVESEVVAATYIIVSTEGDGSEENPYTVADVALLACPGDSAWVTGVILGCADKDGNLAEMDTVDNKILLGANALDSVGVPVQLSKNTLKNALGLKTNPSNKGLTLKVYGKLEKYLSKPGVTNVSDYKLKGGTTLLEVNKASTEKAVKVIENGRMYIIRAGKKYNALGGRL